MAWTSPRTWVSGEVVTASVMNAHVRDNLLALNGFVRKGSAQGYTTTSFVSDLELFYTLPSPSRISIDAYLFVSSASNAAGDIKFQWDVPAGAGVAMGSMGQDISLASGAVGTISSAAGTPVSFGASTTQTMIWLHALITSGGTAGTVTLQAGLNSAAGTTTIQVGSHLIVKQVV